MSDIIDRIKKTIDDEDRQNLNITKPEVKIFEMKIDSIAKLSDIEYEIFSQIDKRDVIPIAKALRFAYNPMPILNAKLISEGHEPVTIPIIIDFVREYFVQNHKVDRKRVNEYLKALENLGVKTETPIKPEGRGFMGIGGRIA